MLFSAQGMPVHAQENEHYKPEKSYQGVINHVDPPGYVFINENKIRLDEDTEIKNYKGKELSIKDLKTGEWVYVVEEEDSISPTATRIYILPKRIKKSEWKKYLFIVKEKEGGLERD